MSLHLGVKEERERDGSNRARLRDYSMKIV